MSLKENISAAINSDINAQISSDAATNISEEVNSYISLKTLSLQERGEIVKVNNITYSTVNDNISMYNNFVADDYYASKSWVLSKNYLTKEDIGDIDITNNIEELLNNKADKNHDHNDLYYTKDVIDLTDNLLKEELTNKIPTKTSQLVNDSNYTTATQLNKVTELIPNTATVENKLVDKNFVNSSISTATATFKGTFDNLTELQQANADLNDYAYFKHIDDNHNIVYSRYKYSDGVWNFEYDLNTTGFTAEQWATINSGVTANSIPTNYVDLTSNQTIDGTKIFTVVPKVYKNAYVNANIVLPDGYQLVEYIQSSGTEYIDTNSRVIANTRFTCTWGSVFNNGSFVASSTENKGYGQGNPSGSSPNIAGGGRLQNGVVTFWFSGSNYSTSLVPSVSTNVYTDIITTSENTLNFSMTDIITNNVFTNTTLTNFTNYPVRNMFLFRDSSGQYPFYSAKKIYDVKFETRASSSEDFVVVKHLIPCYRKSDNVCGFYDIIGNEFYTNKGTGTLIAGSNIVDGKLLYDLGFNYNSVLSELKSITGYNSSKTQVLKNVNGIFKWVDE